MISPTKITPVVASLALLSMAMASGCAQIGNVQIPRNEKVTGIDHRGNAVVDRAAFDQGLIDLYAGRDPRWPSGQAPRLVLKPSPGKERETYGLMTNNFYPETLISRPSGGYFALTTQVPVTRFFKVVKRTDCDDVLWNQLTNTALISRFSQSYSGIGQVRGASQAINCLAALEMHWINSGAVASDIDGVILDPTTTRTPDMLAAPFLGITGLQRVRAKGWSIKFSDPDNSDLEALLDVPIHTLDTIDLIRLRSLLYWAKTNHRVELGPKMLGLLPDLKKKYWSIEEKDVFATIAHMSPELFSDENLLAVLEGGVDGQFFATTKKFIDPVPHQSIELVPRIAAAILSCRPNGGRFKERLENVVRNARFYNHRDAAVLALIAMGDTKIVEEMRQNGVTKVSQDARLLLDLSSIHPFSCKNG